MGGGLRCRGGVRGIYGTESMGDHMGTHSPRSHPRRPGWMGAGGHVPPPPGPDSQGQALMVNPRPPHLCGSQGGWHPGVPHTGRWDPLSHACGVPPTV